MPSRVFHTKNRHGCFGCKQKRKKCNQQSPTCGACAKASTFCVYDACSLKTDSLVSTHVLLGPLTTIEISIQAIISLEMPHVDAGDLELIHHYSNTNSDTFDTIPGLFPVRRLNISKESSRIPLPSLWSTCSLSSSPTIHRNQCINITTLFLRRKSRRPSAKSAVVIYLQTQHSQRNDLPFSVRILRNPGWHRIWLSALPRALP
jgi:hypothetical protein